MQESSEIDALLRNERSIVVALFLGAAAFCGVAFYLRWSGAFGEEASRTAPLMTYCGVLVAVACIGARLVVPKLAAKAQMRNLRGETEEYLVPALCQAHLAGTLTAAALLEGASLMNGVAYLLEGAWINLVVAFALALAVVVLGLSSRDTVEGWIADRRRELEG